MTTPTAPPPAPGTTHSPAPWDLEHLDGSEDAVALKDGKGDVIALLPIRRPERRMVFMGFSTEGAEDPIQERNLEIIRLAPELLAQLAKVASGTHAMLVGMFCLGGISEAHAIKLADQRLQTTNDLITKARGE